MNGRSRFRRPFLALAAAAMAFLGGRAVAYQAHMQNALVALQNASGQLEQARPNKGGHRERALQLVSQAIEQVNLGIKYAEGK